MARFQDPSTRRRPFLTGTAVKNAAKEPTERDGLPGLSARTPRNSYKVASTVTSITIGGAPGHCVPSGAITILSSFLREETGEGTEWPIILADAKPVIVLRNNTNAFLTLPHGDDDNLETRTGQTALSFKKRFIETWLGID
jgi:hypothetical protein